MISPHPKNLYWFSIGGIFPPRNAPKYFIKIENHLLKYHSHHIQTTCWTSCFQKVSHDDDDDDDADDDDDDDDDDDYHAWMCLGLQWQKVCAKPTLNLHWDWNPHFSPMARGGGTPGGAWCGVFQTSGSPDCLTASKRRIDVFFSEVKIFIRYSEAKKRPSLKTNEWTWKKQPWMKMYNILYLLLKTVIVH